MADSCSVSEGPKKVLFYACSGGANVGEVADQAARRLMNEGLGSMFCLAGIGGGVESMLQVAKDADLNVVIDGCDTGCAQKVFEKAEITNVRFVVITDLGIEKAPKGTRATDAEVDKVVAKIRTELANI